MPTTRALALTLVLALATPVTVRAEVGAGAGVGAITVENAWARATAPGQIAGSGYFTLINAGDQPDQLIAVSTPIAAQAQIHRTSMDGGVMRMRELTEGLALPARSRVELKPGGTHLMFMSLQSPFVAGSSFPVTLKFRAAGEVTLRLRVEPITGPSASGQRSVDRP